MTDRELRDELVTLLVAGHETTASALSWGFEQLRARARRARARARARRSTDDDRLPRGDGQGDPAPPPRAADRRSRGRIKQPVEIGGRTLPSRARPSPPASTSSTTTRGIYPEPYAFRPERFLDGTPGKFSWIPFGGGVRRCLGASFAQLEMRIALRAILGAGRGRLRARRPRGHRPALDHAQPAPRDADLGAPARARAAGRRRRLIESAASFSEPRAFRRIAPTAPGQGPQPGRPPTCLGGSARLRSCPRVPVDVPARRSRAAAERLRRRAPSTRRRRRRRSSRPPRPRRRAEARAGLEGRRRGHQGLDRRAAPRPRQGGRALLRAARRRLQRQPGLPAEQALAGRAVEPHAAVRRDVQGGDRHRRLRGRHARPDRAARGRASAGRGVGNEAYTAFLIRRHKIVQWRRVREAGAARRRRPAERATA